VMRPIEDQVVIKSTGMHAVEDYIMSRYQMYWQVYFHPVTRSAEVILSKILHRAKFLFETDYTFKLKQAHFISFFTKNITLEQYLKLDESIVFYDFRLWQEEDDFILRDLCERFMNRRLYKYIEFNPNTQMQEWMELYSLFQKAGIDPDYYLVVDSSSDLPYDFYRPGEEEERLPIHLTMPNNELKELSRHSDIVEAISGKKRTDHKLYFPKDLLEELADEAIKQRIKGILYGGINRVD